MSRLLKAIGIQLLLIIGLVPASVFASTITVGSSGADYTSISAAITAAQSGDVLVLAAETFTEAGLTVTDKSLSFKGQGASSTIVQAASSYNTATDRVFSLSFSSYSTSNIISFEDMTIRYGKKAAAPGGQGGGIAATATVLKIIDCELNSNIAATTSGGYYGEGGGAIWLSTSDLEATGSTFDGNSHTSSFTGDMEGGGAIAFYCNDNLNYMTITNCTFSANSAGNKGGAIMARPPIANSIQITNSTFHGNSAALGGAYMTAGSGANPQPIFFKNTILSGNTASSAGSQVYSTETTNFTFTNSLLESTDAGNLGGVYTDCVVGSDPLLSALADNGGPTRTMLMASGSPAIDAGTSSGAPSVDQRGYNRSGAIDIGSFEFNGMGPQMDAPLTAGYLHSMALDSGAKLFSWGDNSSGQLGDATNTSSNIPVTVDMTGVLAGKTLTALVGSESFSLALTTDGGLYTWGFNGQGQLGNGTNTSSDIPVAVDMTGVLNGKTILAIAAGNYHGMALASDGTVYTWGHNAEGELGNGSTTSSNVPVTVDMTGVLSGKFVTALAAGNTHSVVLANDGNMYSWGGNAHGVLGNNSTSPSLVPVAVVMNGALVGKTVTAISASYLHNLVIASDGKVYGWGANGVGELGEGTGVSQYSPVAVNMSGVLAGKTVTAISTGLLHGLALASDGNLYTWGENFDGQLGNGLSGSENSSWVPVAVDMSGVLAGKTLTRIDAGWKHNIVQADDGSLFSWGENTNGQLGNATNISSNVPVAVNPLIMPPAATTYLTPANGSTNVAQAALLTWEYSDGATGYYFHLGTDNPPTNISNLDLSEVSNFFQDPALTNYGTTYYWSVTPYNAAGEASGVQVWSFTTMADPQMNNPLAAGDAHNLFRGSDGNLYSWGLNAEGQLGDASLAPSNFPVSTDMSGVLAGKTLAGVVGGEAFSLALTTDGGVYAWGRNIHGQLGNGTNISSDVPVAVDMSGALSGKTIVAIAAGSYHALALASDGTVYAWGHNAEGEFGNGSSTSSNVPVAVDMTGVLSGKAVMAMAAGNTHSVVLANDGNMYSWGGNAHGVLGNNSTSPSLVPVAVVMNGALSGKTVTSITASYLHNLVLASDGTIFTWGAGVVGEIGDGAGVSRSVPTAVNMSGTLSGLTVTSIATGFLHSVVLASDGNLYTWGENSDGQLGNGANTQNNVPVAVDMSGVLAGKTLTDLDAGYFHNLVQDSDGNLYTWGKNEHGQLGNASNTSSNVPVAVTFIEPPAAATYLTPANGSSDVAQAALLTWEYSDGATGYYFHLGTDNPPTNISNLDLSEVSNFFQDPALTNYGTTYYWSVTPYNAAGEASGVEVWSFTTMDVPNVAPVFTSTPVTSVMDNEPYAVSRQSNSDKIA